MKRQDAIKMMRELTERNVPFSIGFISCNTTNKTSDGYKVVDKVVLRRGYSRRYSKKYSSLIAYADTATDKDRNFYLPLLMMFNGQLIQP